MHISYIASSVFNMISYMMGESAYAVRSRACILAWIYSASTRSLLYSSLSTARTFSGVISAFILRSASKYGAMQPGHCAVPVRRSPDVEFGSIRFPNRVQNHCRRLHQRERRPRLPPPGPRRLARARQRRPRVACGRVLGPRGTIPRACA
jgi:hypothetical protein